MSAAVVLAGGAARRFGGADKLRHVIDGRAMLTRVIDALRDAQVAQVIVVGPARPGVDDGCTVVREDPPGAGPLAAVAAGLCSIGDPAPAEVYVLAGDLPHLSAGALRELADALVVNPCADAVHAVDDAGRVQELVGLWRVEALRRALAGVGDPRGGAVRELRAGASTVTIRLRHAPDEAPPWRDLDEP